jgi:hypothetical protein
MSEAYRDMEERFLNLTTSAIEAGKASSSTSGQARPEDCDRGGDKKGMGRGFEGGEGEGDVKSRRIVNEVPRIEMFNLKVLCVC